MDGIAFGDLYLEGHREWGEKLAGEALLESIYPLWGSKEDAIRQLNTFVQSGYKATVVRDIAKIDCCPMGESGEYHTFVSDGPLFQAKIELAKPDIITLETTKKYEFKEYKLIPK